MPNEDDAPRLRPIARHIAERIKNYTPEQLADFEERARKRRRLRRGLKNGPGGRPRKINRPDRDLETLRQDMAAGRVTLDTMTKNERRLWMRSISQPTRLYETERSVDKNAPPPSQEDYETDEEHDARMLRFLADAYARFGDAKVREEQNAYRDRRRKHRYLMRLGAQMLKRMRLAEDEALVRKLFESGKHNAASAAKEVPRRSTSWVWGRWQILKAEQAAAADAAERTTREREAALDAADPGRHERDREQFLAGLATLGDAEDE